MTVKVAINGFGRIGRNVLRAIVESGRTDIEVVAINDLGPVETNAHLLRYDSVHGRFPGEVKTGSDWIDIGRGKIKVTAVKNPAELPHKDLGVDIALEDAPDGRRRDGVDALERLIEHQQLRGVEQRNGETDLLAHARGVLDDEGVVG